MISLGNEGFDLALFYGSCWRGDPFLGQRHDRFLGRRLCGCLGKWLLGALDWDIGRSGRRFLRQSQGDAPTAVDEVERKGSLGFLDHGDFFQLAGFDIDLFIVKYDDALARSGPEADNQPIRQSSTLGQRQADDQLSLVQGVPLTGLERRDVHQPYLATRAIVGDKTPPCRSWNALTGMVG